jgi:hypothetical protein
MTTPSRLIKTVGRHCPECGVLMSAPHNKSSGYKCRTDGCNVARVDYSTSPPTVTYVSMPRNKYADANLGDGE